MSCRLPLSLDDPRVREVLDLAASGRLLAPPWTLDGEPFEVVSDLAQAAAGRSLRTRLAQTL